MSLTFANFKQIIPQQILTRGRDYLRQGHILDLSFDEEEGVWEAQVEGSELYDVRIEQTAAGSLLCSCTCPYDMGDYCKHVAAVLYAIEETFPELLVVKPRKSTQKRQTRHDKLRQYLEKASREQLITILLELTQQDRELLNQLLIRLDTGEAKPTDYRRLVKDALRAGKGDYGFLDYTGARRAGRKIEELLTQATRWCETGEIEKAIRIYQAVIDETIAVMEQADDSDGALGDCINLALEGLTKSVSLQDDAGREKLFTFCLERARQKAFHDWDWGWELFNIALELVDTPARRALFTSALEDVEGEVRKSSGSEFYGNFELEQSALFRLSLIERFEGKSAAREFLKANVHLDRLRMVLIERSIGEGLLEEATQLIREGIASSKRHRLPGLTNQYQALQVKLLQASGDKAGLVTTARALWLDRGDDDDFKLLKQAVPGAQWASFVDGLIKDIHRPEQLAWLYAYENRWRDLIILIQSSAQAEWLIEAYREPLESHFADEVATLYKRIIEAILERASGRSHYQQVVAYLRRIKKMNRAAQAEAIADGIRKQYANRPALLDELSRL